MKITYIFKKGLYHAPPCLAQVLHLHDLGVDLTVYHGIESPSVNQLLNERGIEHHVLKSDNTNTGIAATLMKFRGYSAEMRQILPQIPDDEILWFGNLPSVITLGKELADRRYICSLLELYSSNLQGFFGQSILNMKTTLMERISRRNVRSILQNALAVTCCERHRSAIAHGRYGLQSMPYVIPNKPYETDAVMPDEIPVAMEPFQGKYIILYQGIIDPERPLLNIARALDKIHDDNIAFVIMGKVTERDGKHIVDELKATYRNTFELGFIPNPQHLAYTRFADIGIAVYDFSCLNTVFCAPNKIYEYAKFGVPMLCSQNPGLTETVGAAGAGECVNYNSVDAIVEGIQTIMHNREQYRKRAIEFYNAVDNKQVIREILEDVGLDSHA